MKQQELVFRFHNPNNEEDTYNALVKIFTDVGCRKLKEAIVAAVSNNTELDAEKPNKAE